MNIRLKSLYEDKTVEVISETVNKIDYRNNMKISVLQQNKMKTMLTQGVRIL